MKWKTGSKRPAHPLEIEINGHRYKGWVNEIFKQYIRRAGALGERLPHSWEDIVWSKLHEKYPHYIIFESPKSSSAQVSVATVTSFINFVRNRGFNREVVSTQEAERRAEICRNCPMKATMTGCPSCKAAVRAIAGTPKKDFDYGDIDGKPVKACGACGCYLDVKVWIPMEFLVEEKERHEWPEFCWMQGS